MLSLFILVLNFNNISAQDTANKKYIDPVQEQQHINQLQENRNGNQTINNDQEAQNNGQAAIVNNFQTPNGKRLSKKDSLTKMSDSSNILRENIPRSSTQKPVTPVQPNPAVPQQPSPTPQNVTPPNGAQIRQPNGQLNTPPPNK